MVAGRAGLGGTGGRGPAPGNPPLHGQGLPQERCEDGLLVVVGQQEDALDQEAPHLPVVHHGQVHQDGAQDLWHLGVGGGASPGSPALRGLLPSPRRTPLLLPRWTLGRLAHLGPGTARPFQSILWSLRRFYHILTWEVPRFRRGQPRASSPASTHRPSLLQQVLSPSRTRLPPTLYNHGLGDGEEPLASEAGPLCLAL